MGKETFGLRWIERRRLATKGVIEEMGNIIEKTEEFGRGRGEEDEAR